MSDRYWMQQAYEQALCAQQEGEIPVGAVLVSRENQVLGIGRNRVQVNQDPTQHAELCVLRQASQALTNHRLVGTTLYVTLEPCAMCAGALVLARIQRLVFATRDFKTGAAGSVYNLLRGYPLNHQVQIDEGILQAECATLLRSFFRARRTYE